VTDIMQKDSGLQVLQETHGLQKDGDAQTGTDVYNGKSYMDGIWWFLLQESLSHLPWIVSIAGNCPYEECSVLLRTSVGFIHDDSLRSGELIYSLYQFADTITKVVAQEMSEVNVMYVGPRDVAATFGIVLGGVPQGMIMNAVQQEYFADVTVDFLSTTSAGDRVLDLQIDEQIDNDGSIQVLGKLLGASYKPAAAFANGLESSFREGQDAYVQRLILDRLRPNVINEIGGIEFFEGISSVGGTVDVDADAATPQMDDGGSGSLLIVVIVSAVGGIALMLIACWYCRTRRKLNEEKQEVKVYRERMKVERRTRREEAKETLLGQGEDPEDAYNFREVITSSSDEGSDCQNVTSSDDDGRQSTVSTAIVADDSADFADFPEDSGSLQQPNAASKETKNERGERSIPVAVKSAKSNILKEKEEIPPGSPGKKPQLRSVESLDELSGNPERRSPPKPEKSMDNDEDSQQPDAAFEAATSPTPKGASPAELSQFMTKQPKLPTKKLSGSRSVQYQPPSALGPAPREVKEAEDVTPGARKRVAPKPSKSMDSDELLSRSSPRQRAPPKPAKSMDGNEFLSQAAPAKKKGASPAALSRFMKAEPKSSASKLSGSRSVQLPPTSGPTSKKIKEAEDVSHRSPRSPRRQPPVRGNTKSLDECDFKGTRVPPLGKINEGSVTPGSVSGAPTPKGASPVLQGQAQPKPPTRKYQPPGVLDPTLVPTSTKVKDAEDVLLTSPRKRLPVRGASQSLDESSFKGKLSPHAGP
jgi:hypothetical protein